MMRPAASIAILLALSAASGAASSAPLNAAERRGRDIYLRGESAAGRPVSASLAGDPSNAIAASVLTCASCHGPDGRGAPEGLVAPAEITGSALGKPFAAAGRRRIAYDDASLARAIGEGVDPAGAPLSAAMPRYAMDARDLADLLAYLRKLGDEPQPGLDADAITVATIASRVPSDETMRAAIAAVFDDVNAQGGLFGRRLKLQAVDSAGALASGPYFAVVGASAAGESIESVVRRERIPLVTPFPSALPNTAPSSFFLFSDLTTQSAALIEHAARIVSAPRMRRIVIVRDDTPAAMAAADAAEARADALGWPLAKDVGALSDHDVVMLVGAVDPIAALRGLRARPIILVAGSAMTKELFALPPESRIFVSFPTVPGDVTEAGARELAAFAARHHLGGAQRPAQIAGYCAAKLFVDALRRIGRDVTREKLIAELERTYGFATELTPPFSFSPGRHIGAAGAYVVAVDIATKAFTPASGWIVPRGDR